MSQPKVTSASRPRHLAAQPGGRGGARFSKIARPGQIVSRRRGFTLIEVMVSILVLAIGLLGVAALIAGTVTSGSRAKYMSMASLLASEQLDAWNALPVSDPAISCNGAASCGSLAGGTACAAADPYCDTITVSQTSGADYETQTLTNGGQTTTTTIVETQSGCTGTPAVCGVPNPTGGATFTRRTLIQVNPTLPPSAGGGGTVVNNTRRVTVLVMLINGSQSTPVSFQMSMVRP